MSEQCKAEEWQQDGQCACGHQKSEHAQYRYSCFVRDCSCEKWATPPAAAGERQPAATCPTHGDPLVCLACEQEEDELWKTRGYRSSEKDSASTVLSHGQIPPATKETK